MPKKLNFQTVPLSELPTEMAAFAESEPPKPIVLVVDDEVVIADTLASILRQSGFAAMSAYDGRGALELARRMSPDLLLSDVMMPEMSGVELAIEIQKSVPDCKILLFSGTPATANLLAMECGAGRDYVIISKPIHPGELLVLVGEALHPPTAK